MSTPIKDLTEKTSVVAGDQWPIYSTNDGNPRKVSTSTLLTYINANAVLASALVKPTTQYASPLTGETVTVTDGDDDDADVHLIVTPAGTIATLTITLPASTSIIDKQTVIVNTTQTITALTVNGNGATVSGDPTTLAADGYFTMKYDEANTIWYRVG